jgi:glutaconate CoA-transferase subunit B
VNQPHGPSEVSDPYGPAEMMAVAMARLIRDGELVFVGVNSPLPLVAANLARALHAPNCTLLTIGGGINPRPAKLDPATSSAKLSAGSASVFDNVDFYGLIGRRGIDTTFLGLGQVDARGRVNSSFIGEQRRPTVRFPGGGGAATILPLSRRVILWRASHSPRIFVNEVSFVTSAGNIDRVVTPLCIFRKEDGALVLDSIHPYVTRGRLAESTGFSVRNLEQAAVTPPPTDQELAELDRVDPEGIRRIEFPSRALDEVR